MIDKEEFQKEEVKYMIEEKEKINFEILQFENGIIEIIIRGEKRKKNIGIKINLTDENINISEFTTKITDMKYSQVISFLKEKNIKFDKVKFL